MPDSGVTYVRRAITFYECLTSCTPLGKFPLLHVLYLEFSEYIKLYELLK